MPPRATASVPVVSERAMPKVEVASCCHDPPAYDPRSMPAALGLEMPVPPPPEARRPASVFVKVRVFPDPVIVVDAVSPLKALDDVAIVMVGPVWV